MLLSSHLLAEVSLLADEVVVIDRGRLVTQTTVEQLTAGSSVVLRSPRAATLRAAVIGAGGTVHSEEGDRLVVSGLSTTASATWPSARGSRCTSSARAISASSRPSSTSRRDRAMRAHLRAELIKLTTTRGPYGLLATAVALVALATWSTMSQLGSSVEGGPGGPGLPLPQRDDPRRVRGHPRALAARPRTSATARSSAPC